MEELINDRFNSFKKCKALIQELADKEKESSFYNAILYTIQVPKEKFNASITSLYCRSSIPLLHAYADIEQCKTAYQEELAILIPCTSSKECSNLVKHEDAITETYQTTQNKISRIQQYHDEVSLYLQKNAKEKAKEVESFLEKTTEKENYQEQQTIQAKIEQSPQDIE